MSKRMRATVVAVLVLVAGASACGGEPEKCSTFSSVFEAELESGDSCS